jgi:hypothetical protein
LAFGVLLALAWGQPVEETLELVPVQPVDLTAAEQLIAPHIGFGHHFFAHHYRFRRFQYRYGGFDFIL